MRPSVYEELEGRLQDAMDRVGGQPGCQRKLEAAERALTDENVCDVANPWALAENLERVAVRTGDSEALYLARIAKMIARTPIGYDPNATEDLEVRVFEAFVRGRGGAAHVFGQALAILERDGWGVGSLGTWTSNRLARMVAKNIDSHYFEPVVVAVRRRVLRQLDLFGRERLDRRAAGERRKQWYCGTTRRKYLGGLKARVRAKEAVS